MSSVDRIPARRVDRLPLRNALYNPGQNSVSQLRAPLTSTDIIRGTPPYLPAVVGDVDGNRLTLNDEDFWESVKAEEMRQYGLLDIRNQVLFSENFADPSWTAQGLDLTSGQIDHLGGTKAFKVTENNTSSNPALLLANPLDDPSTYIASVWLRSDSGTPTIKISADSDTEDELITLSTTWQRRSTAATGANGRMVIGGFNSITQASGLIFYVSFAQVEDSTGRADTTTPRSYVSTGVGTGPEEVTNGSNLTDTTGWTAGGPGDPADLSIVNGGLQVQNNGASQDRATQIVTTVAGRTYLFSIDTDASSSVDPRLNLGSSGSASTEYLNNTFTKGESFSLVFTATNTTTAITLKPESNSDDANTIFQNISIKQIDHGANVDGVRYSTFLNGNTVDSNVVTEIQGAAIDPDILKGAFMEGAVTEQSGFSADIGNWASGTSASVARDALGLQGEPTEAETLTDSSAVAIENRRVDTVIPDDAKKRYMRIRTPFNASATVFPHFLFSLNDGTPLNQAVVFDPRDGTHVVTSSDGSVLTTERVGDWWFITLLLTNNSTGNIQAAMTISPAFNDDATGSGDATIQGDTVIATCELTEDVWSHSPIKTTGGTTKTRLADVEATLPLANFNDSEGSIEFDLTPFFGDGTGATQGILTPNSTNTSRLFNFSNVDGRIDMEDGTSTSLLAVGFAAGDILSIKGRWGNGTMQFSVNGVLSDLKAFDGSWTPSGAQTLGKDLLLGMAMKNWKTYFTDLRAGFL